MTVRIVSIWAGFLLDRILGDPQGWPHPVRLIGSLIIFLESKLRKAFPRTKNGELAAGRELVILTVMATGIAAQGILMLAGKIHPLAVFFVMTVMNYWLIAAKCLKTESMKVYTALKADDVEGARQAVSMIVGRDTQNLTQEGITKAAVETVAENTSDGVTAPLFYAALFGPLVAFLYKAVNTMDSMVGYRNEKYLYFGRAAAKVDDIVNYIPSRLTAVFLIAAAYLLPDCDGKHASRIWARDRGNHKSPNSAQGEAACAGALHVQLAGDAWYFGELYHKPTIGDPDRPIEAEDIVRANRLMYTASFLMLIFMSLFAYSWGI